MRQHVVIWSLAAAVLTAALALSVLRTAFQDGAPTNTGLTPEAAIAEALALLEKDHSAAEAATQDAIRAAAVLAWEDAVLSAEAGYLLALQYQREHNLRGAEAYFKRAIALRPGWSPPYSGLGWLLGIHSMDRTDEAKEMLRKAIALDPSDSRPHITLAVLLRYEGRLDEAEQAALEALRLDPDSVRSHNNYANLLIRRNEFEKAERHYREAIGINPERTKPWYNLACLYSLTGRTEEALQYLEKACDLEPAYRAQALHDKDLDGIREEPGFHKLIFGRDAQ